MRFQVNLNGHAGYLPAGKHRVKIKQAGERTAKSSGNPQVALELQAVEGEQQGKIARAWITEAPGTETFWKYFAKAVFPEATGNSIQFEPDDLVGREVQIKVEWPEDAEYPQVAEYYPV
jgi:Protein of unknown function (DUF669)